MSNQNDELKALAGDATVAIPLTWDDVKEKENPHLSLQKGIPQI